VGKYLEASIEQLDKATSLRPFNWEPRKFFAFLMANSKGRFQTWIAPVACSFKRFLDWDFSVGISAIQGHSRMPEQVADIAQGERLTLAQARELGYIFHAAENPNYESIKSDGLLLRATRKGWQRHRVAIHLTYAGGSESPCPGTVIRYGANIFYAQLDVGTFFNHGHELFLTDNGVVLCYTDIAPMYLTFHYITTGGSPSGEAPVVDEASLRRLIREAGDTVHGRVDATRLQQKEELRDSIQK
ncbi:unnamed protein product, partial [Symbiodinium microadriaticum]